MVVGDSTSWFVLHGFGYPGDFANIDVRIDVEILSDMLNSTCLYKYVSSRNHRFFHIDIGCYGDSTPTEGDQ